MRSTAFGMHDVRRILESLPEKHPRSRLEPYRKLIKGLLRHRRTYREIAQILAVDCQIRVSISTIHDFVRLRSRAKRNLPMCHPPKPLKEMESSTTARAEEKKASRVEKEMPAVDEVYQRIAALKQRPSSTQSNTKLFHYDPDEPLHLPGKAEQKKTGK